MTEPFRYEFSQDTLDEEEREPMDIDLWHGENPVEAVVLPSV